MRKCAFARDYKSNKIVDGGLFGAMRISEPDTYTKKGFELRGVYFPVLGRTE